MRSPRLQESEVASYRSDENASGLGTVRLLGPVVFSNLGGFSVSAGGTNPFLLVVSASSTASATDMGGLLSSTHGWCTFGHNLTRTSCPPTSPL